jgi:GTP-binding protein
MPSPLKTVAIVGRPNVGKSALFNRLAGKTISIVHDQAGVTRDRITAQCRRGPAWFEIMDTGGIGASTDDVLTDQVQIEASIALDVADLLLFVVDVVDGITTIDQSLARELRRTSKPVILVCNKADSPKRKLNAGEFSKFGFKDTVEVSAAHGLGIDDLVALVAERLDLQESTETEDAKTGQNVRPLKLAIVGRPNAGKSSLVNAILGQERAIVSEVPAPRATRSTSRPPGMAKNTSSSTPPASAAAPTSTPWWKSPALNAACRASSVRTFACSSSTAPLARRCRTARSPRSFWKSASPASSS